MKRFLVIAICSILLLTSGYAQTEVSKDSVSIIQAVKLPESNLLNEAKPDVEHLSETRALSAEELQRRVDFVKRLQFDTPPLYVGPATENKTLGEKLPYNNDYSFYDYESLGNDFVLGGGSLYRSYPTIGAMQMVRADLGYRVADWLDVSGGVYGAKYTAYGYFYNDAGVNASMRFKLSDRVFLRAHGSYSINSHDKNRYIGPASMGMFPQTYYGGGLEFKISDSFGVEGGVIREFNPMKRKWENVPYIMPVFYSNGRRR